MGADGEAKAHAVSASVAQIEISAVEPAWSAVIVIASTVATFALIVGMIGYLVGDAFTDRHHAAAFLGARSLLTATLSPAGPCMALFKITLAAATSRSASYPQTQR